MNWLEAVYLLGLIIAGFWSVYHTSRQRRRQQLRGFDVKAKDNPQRL